MRIVRYKLKKDTRIVVKDFAREKDMDADFMLDLYALLKLKGAGLPTEDRLKKMIRYVAPRRKVSEISLGIIANKHKQNLKIITGNAVFLGFAQMKDTIGALRGLIATLEDAKHKTRQAQCMTCNLKANCEFGKQYGEQVFNISKVLDADYSKKAHKDCPHLPEIEKTNQLAVAAQALSDFFGDDQKPEQNVVKNDEKTTSPEVKEAINKLGGLQSALDAAGGFSQDGDSDDLDADADRESPEMLAAAMRDAVAKGTAFDVTFTGQNVKTPEDMVKTLTTAQLALYELGKNFSDMLTKQKKGKYKPTPEVAKDNTVKKIDTFSEVTKVSASQQAMPDEVFDAKLAKKQLVKIQPQQPEDKKSLLYLVIDASISMKGWLTGGQLLTRSAVASVITLAVTRRLEADDGIIFCRFFAEGYSRMFSAKKAQRGTYDELRHQISMCSFNGSGTDIIRAITKVAEDITNAQDEINKAEILLITDCESAFDADAVRKAIGKVPLNVLDVAGSSLSGRFGGSKALKACSTKYYKADEKALDLSKIVDLV